MQRLTSDEQLEQIWNLAIEAGIAPIRTVDRWGEPFTIFEDWSNVEAVAELIYSNFTVLSDESAPSWEHLPESYRPNPYHHIEWAIGEFGFSDQYSTCDNCYTAIDTCDYHPDHYCDYDAGVIMCGDCVRKDRQWGDEYLTYCARKMEEDGYSVIKRLADPDQFGFVCVNAQSAGLYCEVDNPTDHPAYKDYWLTFAGSEEMKRLAKAARLIDPMLQIVYVADGGSNVIWARFNPNESRDYADHHANGWCEYPYDDGDGATAPGCILGYALTLVFAKYEQLRMKRQ